MCWRTVVQHFTAWCLQENKQLKSLPTLSLFFLEHPIMSFLTWVDGWMLISSITCIPLSYRMTRSFPEPHHDRSHSTRFLCMEEKKRKKKKTQLLLRRQTKTRFVPSFLLNTHKVHKIRCWVPTPVVLTGCNSFHNLHMEFQRRSRHTTKGKTRYCLTRDSLNIAWTLGTVPTNQQGGK